ncbi:hypothetical protein BDN71DRAFT_1510154 [Pleurotus eryngii]|uniref:Uncharacterized protein n=1 Tax=Pleurotus eryngii TaxID=5323 RepID=A0A9P6DDB3_PLEER|nr:hypothetical protein BDN71DRAFT_1510154 [Pleurotus eryngii]
MTNRWCLFGLPLVVFDDLVHHHVGLPDLLPYYRTPPRTLSPSKMFSGSVECVLVWDREDCLRFIQHDFYELDARIIEPNENDDAHTVIDVVCKTVAPLALDRRHAAIDRSLSRDDLIDEFTQPLAQLIRRRASTPAENHISLCVLMLHLDVRPWVPHDGQNSYIFNVRRTATDRIPSHPSSSNPFLFQLYWWFTDGGNGLEGFESRAASAKEGQSQVTGDHRISYRDSYPIIAPFIILLPTDYVVVVATFKGHFVTFCKASTICLVRGGRILAHNTTSTPLVLASIFPLEFQESDSHHVVAWKDGTARRFEL